MKPTARVAVAKTAIVMTDFVNGRIDIIMFIKIEYEKGKLFEIAKTCGVAPCTIILANGKRSEDELSGTILVPVSTPACCKLVPR
jgi:hypothetical protein